MLRRARLIIPAIPLHIIQRGNKALWERSCDFTTYKHSLMPQKQLAIF